MINYQEIMQKEEYLEQNIGSNYSESHRSCNKYDRSDSNQKLKDFRISSIKQLLHVNKPDDIFLKISIVDTGSGMDHSSSASLFNLFGKVKLSEDKISQQGMGLGLAVSSQVCEKLKGRMFLDWTMRGRGSKFIVCVPV